MITVNGRQIEHGKKITVERLLRELKYTFPLIVVRVNGKIIPKEKYNTMVIHNGDLIDVIHLIAGG